MPDDPKNERKIRERLQALEENQQKIAEALSKINEEIAAEWDEIVVPEGTVICGIQF